MKNFILGILGFVYNMFTKNIIGNVVGVMLASFVQYVAGSWCKNLFKNASGWFATLLSVGA